MFTRYYSNKPHIHREWYAYVVSIHTHTYFWAAWSVDKCPNSVKWSIFDTIVLYTLSPYVRVVCICEYSQSR